MPDTAMDPSQGKWQQQFAGIQKGSVWALDLATVLDLVGALATVLELELVLVQRFCQGKACHNSCISAGWHLDNTLCSLVPHWTDDANSANVHLHQTHLASQVA